MSLSLVALLFCNVQQTFAQICYYTFTATPVPCTNSVQFQTIGGCSVGNGILGVSFDLYFGDGTDTTVSGGGQINIVHTYPSAGVYVPFITTSILIQTSLGNQVWSQSGTWPDLYDNVSDEVQAGIIIKADGPTTFCGGNSVNLSATSIAGAVYQWRRNNVDIAGANTRNYTARTSGTHTCRVTCGGQSLTSNAISVVTKSNTAVTLSASGPTTFCAGDSVVLTATNPGANYSIRWLRTNVLMENSSQYSQVVKQPGTYKVVTTNISNDCFRVSSGSVVVAVNCRLANPEDVVAEVVSSDFTAKSMQIEEKGRLYVWPNPSEDHRFTIEFISLDIDGSATLELYNGIGQLLSTEQVIIADGYLQRIVSIPSNTDGQLCLVRLIVGGETYDSKVLLK